MVSGAFEIDPDDPKIENIPGDKANGDNYKGLLRVSNY